MYDVETTHLHHHIQFINYSATHKSDYFIVVICQHECPLYHSTTIQIALRLNLSSLIIQQMKYIRNYY